MESKNYIFNNLKITKNIQEANCITHTGKFHTDEVFATVILSKVLKEVKLIRVNEISENLKVLENQNKIIIYDIGGGKHDHHQPRGNGVRENGVKYAACGLIWRNFGKELLKNIGVSSEEIDEIYKKIDKNLIQYIDANDNGETPKIDTDYKFIELSSII